MCVFTSRSPRQATRPSHSQHTSSTPAPLPQSLEKKYLGQKIQVSLVDADVPHQQLIGSLEHARINDFIRGIQVGSEDAGLN